MERLNKFLKVTRLVSVVPGIQTLAPVIPKPTFSLSHSLHASTGHGSGQATSVFSFMSFSFLLYKQSK